jgi:hypothetical protein
VFWAGKFGKNQRVYVSVEGETFAHPTAGFKGKQAVKPYCVPCAEDSWQPFYGKSFCYHRLNTVKKAEQAARATGDKQSLVALNKVWIYIQRTLPRLRVSLIVHSLEGIMHSR